MEYTIKSGDTLSQIAQANNTTVEALAKANQIADPNKIIAGATLTLPDIQPIKQQGVDMSANEITSGIPELPQATPEIKPDTTANAILAYTTSEQLKTAEERKKLEETAQKTLGTTDLLEAAGTRPTIDLATIRATEQEKTGATALREDVAQQSLKLAEIKGERDRLDIMEQNEIEALTKAGVTRGAIERETAAIQRKYASKKAKLSADLNAEASMLAAMQGNYAMAQEAANQAVEDYVFDYKQKVETFDNVFNVYSDLVADLTDRERSILETAAKEAQNELDKVTQEKKDIMNLRLQYAGAGINMDDTLEIAMEKAERVAASDAEVQRALKQAQLTEAQADGIGMETLFSLYSQVEDIMSKDKTLSSTEAISKLPVPQSIKTQLLLMDSQIRASQQEELYTDINRINTEPITKELVSELSGKYGFEELKQSALDEETRNKLIQVNGELAAESRQQAAEAFGSSLSGVRDWWRENIYMGGIYEGLGGFFSPIVEGFKEGIKK